MPLPVSLCHSLPPVFPASSTVAATLVHLVCRTLNVFILLSYRSHFPAEPINRHYLRNGHRMYSFLRLVGRIFIAVTTSCLPTAIPALANGHRMYSFLVLLAHFHHHRYSLPFTLVHYHHSPLPAFLPNGHRIYLIPSSCWSHFPRGDHSLSTGRHSRFSCNRTSNVFIPSSYWPHFRCSDHSLPFTSVHNHHSSLPSFFPNGHQM